MQERAGQKPGADQGLDRRFREPLFAFFLKRVHSRAEAEDLTQETFVRLAAHPDTRDGTTLNSYVFTIAANLLRDRARQRGTRNIANHTSLQEFPDAIAESLVEDRTPERVLMAKDALKGILAALGELSEKTRDIFILSRLENIPQREIAALYGISVSAVEKHIIKAAAHLGARNLK